MANVGPVAWYLNSVGYAAVPAWAASHSYAPGALVRQLANTLATGQERVFANVTASTSNTSSSASEPTTWTVTKGGTTADGSITWQECTGQPGVNGDVGLSLGSTTLHNTPTWTEQHNSSTAITAGLIIQDATGTGSVLTLWIAKSGTTIGASNPFTGGANAAGTSVLDNSSVTWISLGPASNFGTWAAPFARMQSTNGAGWMSANNRCYASDNHAETQSTALSMTFTSLTSYICIDSTVLLPPTSSNLKNTAKVITTGNSALTTNVASNGSCYIYGVIFQCGTGAVNAALTMQGLPLKLENCALQKLGTTGNVAAQIWIGVDLVNTPVKFGNTGDSLKPNGSIVRWRNTPSAIDATGSIPTNLAFVGVTSVLLWDGLDLSAMTSGNIIGGAIAGGQVTNCLLGSSSVVMAANPNQRPLFSDLMFCDSSGTTWQHQRVGQIGAMNAYNNVYRTGGASNGVTNYSWRFDSLSNAMQWESPFEFFPIAQWNTVIGSNRTVTIYGIASSSAMLNNDAIWMDVEYMGSSSSPIVTKVTTTKVNVLATGTANTADLVSQWNGPPRLNSTTYNITSPVIPMSVSTNPGQLFFCTANGTTGASLPSTYAPGGVPVADGTIVTDGGQFRAGYRFSMSITLSSPAPALIGDIIVQIYSAVAFQPIYIDPRMVLS